MHAPREPHLTAMKRIFRYIKGTLDYGLHLSGSSSPDLIAYSDADWDGYPDTRCSTSRYCVFLGNNLISWSFKWQSTLSRSSAEAQYRGVVNTVAKTSWIRNILLELHRPIQKANVIYCDNISAVYLLCNPVQNQCTKHIEMDIHFVREKVIVGEVRVLHVPSSLRYAYNMLTYSPKTYLPSYLLNFGLVSLFVPLLASIEARGITHILAIRKPLNQCTP